MAWNKPSDRTEGKDDIGARQKPRPFRRGLAAGLLVAALGGVVALWFCGRDEAPSASKDAGRKPQGAIRAVAPAVTNRAPAKAVAVAPEPCRTNKWGYSLRQEKVTVDENGKRWFMGQPVPDTQPGDAFQNGRRVGHIDHFKTAGENFLAAQVLGEAGLPSSAPRELPKGLVRNIREHLKDPVEIGPDDSPEVVQLKRDMVELKAELADRIDKGESLEAILDGVRGELEYYCNMRQGYQDGLKQLEKSGATEVELREYVEAANRILGEKGARKIDLPMSIKRKMLKEKLAAIKEGRAK